MELEFQILYTKILKKKSTQKSNPPAKTLVACSLKQGSTTL